MTNVENKKQEITYQCCNYVFSALCSCMSFIHPYSLRIILIATEILPLRERERERKGREGTLYTIISYEHRSSENPMIKLKKDYKHWHS